MFQDTDSSVIGFEATSQEKRLVSDKSEQTNALQTSNNKIQTSEVQHAEIQTAPQDMSTSVKSSPSYDVDKLAAFLKKLLPKLEEELEDFASKNDASYRNKQEKSLWYNEQECQNDDAANFSSKQISFQQDFLKDNIVSDVAWNSNGDILAICFSKTVHEGWCNHEVTIRLYNVNKPSFEKSPPKQTLNTFSCVRCVKFHPYNSSILACGLYNGDVLLWNLSSEDEILYSREKETENVECHIDEVKCLVWKEDQNGVKLVSAGRDGKIIFWTVKTGTFIYKPEERFAIVIQDFMKVSTSGNRCLEINSISFWHDNTSEFVVAAGSNVFHCSSKFTKSISWMPHLRDPFLMNYKPHEGLATCVSCLSQSDLFASSGIDGKIHINKSKMNIPVYVIYSNQPMMGIKWSGETNLIAWEAFSIIKNYKINMKNFSLVSTATQEVKDDISAVAIKRSGKLAVGKATGVKLLNEFNF